MTDAPSPKAPSNTLFVTTQGAYLSREGETVLIRVEQETRLKVPIHTLSGIVCFGQVSVQPAPGMELCGERNVLISFHSERGQVLGRVQGPVSGNVLAAPSNSRLDDARAGDITPRHHSSQGRELAGWYYSGIARIHSDSPTAALLLLQPGRLAGMQSALQIPRAAGHHSGPRGRCEPDPTFGVFDHLIVAQKDDFFFRERAIAVRRRTT